MWLATRLFLPAAELTNVVWHPDAVRLPSVCEPAQLGAAAILQLVILLRSLVPAPRRHGVIVALLIWRNGSDATSRSEALNPKASPPSGVLGGSL
jgi:hypothetical protein